MVYATLIIKGKKTFQDVPDRLKEQVKEILYDLDCGRSCGPPSHPAASPKRGSHTSTLRYGFPFLYMLSCAQKNIPVSSPEIHFTSFGA